VASTVWKGQLAFGLVSFPVRLQKAARRNPIALKYAKQIDLETADQSGASTIDEQSADHPSAEVDTGLSDDSPGEIVPLRQGYFSEGQREPSFPASLQRGYEVAPDQFVTVRPEELKKLRKATSPDMQILRSVQMQEIDPVFLETSYYIIPGAGGEHSYGLFYRALAETQLAALAQVAMHGREHIVVLRAGGKGLIAHTMFYVTEVRAGDEYTAPTADLVDKELDLAKKYVQTLQEPFRPEEFADTYREQLQALIASKQVSQRLAEAAQPKATGKVVDIMEALRKSLESAKARVDQRKPVASEAIRGTKSRRRRA
jgi:DNA end-binding protein Ku